MRKILNEEHLVRLKDKSLKLFLCFLVVFVDVVDTEYNDSVTVQFLPTSEYNPFRIITSPGGGRVILEQPLLPDKESYNLTIQASDRLGHTSQAQLIITIYDVNDHTVNINDLLFV